MADDAVFSHLPGLRCMRGLSALAQHVKGEVDMTFARGAIAMNGAWWPLMKCAKSPIINEVESCLFRKIFLRQPSTTPTSFVETW